MKKNLLNLIFTFCLLTSSAYAATIRVISMEDFSTEMPASTFSVKTTQLETLDENLFFERDTIISGTILNVHEPKRGKRDGYFEFQPITATYNGETKDISDSNIIAAVKGYEPLNPQQAILSGGRTVAGLFVKGASQGLSFVQGVAQNQEGNRLKSGFKKIYKDSPLSYIEVGEELNIKAGDTIVLQIKKAKE